VVPQLYRSSYADFAPLLADTLGALYGTAAPLTDSRVRATTTTARLAAAAAAESPSSSGTPAVAAGAVAVGAAGAVTVGAVAAEDSSPPFVAMLGVGLRVDGSGAATPWADLEAMLDALNDPPQPTKAAAATAAAAAAAAAVGPIPPCLWYSHGALELYPAELGAYWANSSKQATNPVA